MENNLTTVKISYLTKFGDHTSTFVNQVSIQIKVLQKKGNRKMF